MESFDHIQNTIAEIRTTPGAVSEADQLLAMAAEAQRTGKMPDLTQLITTPAPPRSDLDLRRPKFYMIRPEFNDGDQSTKLILSYDSKEDAERVYDQIRAQLR